MSFTVTAEGPYSRKSLIAAARRASRVSAFLRSRSPVDAPGTLIKSSPPPRTPSVLIPEFAHLQSCTRASFARLRRMASAHAKKKRPGEIVRTLAMGLWLPALFLAGLLFSFLPAFRHPAPHHVEVAVAAPPATTAQLQTRLDAVLPDGFTLQPVDSVAEAR